MYILNTKLSLLKKTVVIACVLAVFLTGSYIPVYAMEENTADTLSGVVPQVKSVFTTIGNILLAVPSIRTIDTLREAEIAIDHFSSFVESLRPKLTAQVIGEVAPTVTAGPFFQAKDSNLIHPYIGSRGSTFAEVSGKAVRINIWMHDKYHISKSLNQSLTIIYTLNDVPISPRLTAPYTFDWDSTTVADGTHALGLVIVDGAGDLSAYRVRSNVVIVDNIPGAVTGTQRIPTLGASHLSNQSQLAMADWITHSSGYTRAHPATVAFNAPVVPPAHTLPNPASGLESKNWFWEPLTQTSAGLYADLPGMYRTKTGHLIIDNVSHQLSADGPSSVGALLKRPTIDGPRNDNEASGYTTYVPNPEGRGFVGVDIAGRIFKVNMDGSIVTIAGRQTKRDVVPYYPHDSRVTEADRLAYQVNYIGSYENNIKLKVPHDLAYDPRNSNILYIADTLNYRIAKVDFSGAVPHVSTYAGSVGTAGNKDGSALTAQFSQPTSIVATVDGTLYVADETNDSIRAISPDGKTVRTVASAAEGIADPFSIRHDSEGNIMIAERANGGRLKRLNVSNGQVATVATVCSSEWIWIDVDWRGNVGPKDDVFFICARGGAGNKDMYRLSKDGTRKVNPAILGAWTLRFGFVGQTSEPQGHYPWVMTIDDNEARMLTHGFGDSAPHSLRMSLPTDKQQSNTYPFYSGMSGIPSGSRPSGAALRSKGMTRLAIPTYDDLGKMTDAQLAQYIQGGMGGAVPRPEYTGRDLIQLIHSIRLYSAESMTNPPVRATFPADKTAPIISNVQVELVDGTTARVTWNTNEPTWGFVQFGTASTHHRWSDMETSYSTTHSVLLRHLPENKTVNFAVRSKDEAGNQTLTANRTFVSGAAGADSEIPPPPPPAPSCSFSSSPTTIEAESSAMLSWSTQNASSVSINNNIGNVAVSGTRSVSPTASGIYTLTATGQGGTASCDVTLNVTQVSVVEAPTCNLTVTPSTIQAGSEATLTWTSVGATSAALNNNLGTVNINGSRAVSPDSSGTYVLTVTNSAGTASCTVPIEVTESASPQPQLPDAPSVPDILKGDVVAINDGLWSKASTWNTGAVPQAIDDVQISGVTVEYDLVHNSSASAEAKSIIVSDGGTLSFSRDKSTRLDVDGSISVLNGGTLDIGSQNDPIPSNINTYVGFNVPNDRDFRTSTDPAPIPSEPDFRPEDAGLWVTAGGRMDIHGAPKAHVWTKLAQTSVQGSREVTLSDTPTGWRVGDTVMVTPTGSDPDEVELRKIVSISGKKITLNTPLNHTHEAEFYAVTGSTNEARKLPNATAKVNSGEISTAVQGEVALLTQNVTIASNLVKAGDTNHRAHSFYLKNTSGSLSYAEFRNMGARAKLGRYPVHLHLTGSTVRNFPIIGLSVWNEFEPGNKWIVLHMTQDAVVRGNVGYNAQGRGFYMETADETGNVLEGNLGVRVFGPEEIPNTIPGVAAIQQLTRPGIFWVRDGNTVRNNVAVGGKADVGGMWVTPNVLDDVPTTDISNNELRTNEFGLYLSGDTLMTTEISDTLAIRNEKALWSDDLNIRSAIIDSILLENQQSGSNFEGVSGTLTVFSLAQNQELKTPEKIVSCTFKSVPASVRAGDTAKISWTTKNASSVSINHGLGVVSLSGETNVTVTDNTNFVLTASGGDAEGDVTCFTSIAVHNSADDHSNPGESIDVPKEREKSNRGSKSSSLSRGNTPSSKSDSTNTSGGTSTSLSRNLARGSSGSDVRKLQEMLNNDPTTRVAQNGNGSVGNESTYFGAATEAALKRFQTKHGIIAYGTPATTGYGALGPKTRAKLQELYGSAGVSNRTSSDTASQKALREQYNALLKRIDELLTQLRALQAVTQVRPVTSSSPDTSMSAVQRQSTSYAAQSFIRTLKSGDQNAQVSLLQYHLATDAPLYPEGMVTGYYGTLTEQAVERFQRREGIIPAIAYGTVDEQTRKRLNEVYGNVLAPVFK